ncbi:MAG: carboxymuconolactone decarboxylase family protein [Deltaproteobacteria bacterium]|nr:carboxymuconolactone decarboxylase family protein [Deltaproteobacteria bacterium]
MSAFIEPPTRIPLFLKAGILLAEKITGKPMLPARLLAWYPKAALGSAALEGLVAHHDGKLNKRILKLVRLSASFAAGCPFCIDMNSAEWSEAGLVVAEIRALQEEADPESVPSLSTREKLAVRYARLISSTPLRFPPEYIGELTANFTEREIVVLASTAAQVNYWARLIQALGIPPAGFSDVCPIMSQRHASSPGGRSKV